MRRLVRQSLNPFLLARKTPLFWPPVAKISIPSLPDPKTDKYPTKAIRMPQDRSQSVYAAAFAGLATP